MKRFLVIPAWIGLLVVCPARGIAQTDEARERTWSAAEGGRFDDPGHWQPPGVPGEDASVVFDGEAPEPYVVSLDADRRIGSFHIRQDRVTLDLGGHTLTLTDDGTGNFERAEDGFTGVAALTVGRGIAPAHHAGYVRITGGGTFDTGDGNFILAGTSGSIGELIVAGAGTVFQGGSTGAIGRNIIGYLGDARLIVRDGAMVNLPALYMARHGPGSSAIIVEGGGSTLNTGALHAAYRGETDIHIRDRGTLNSSIIILGTGSDTRAELDVRNAMVDAGEIQLARGDGVGALRILDGGAVRATNVRVGRADSGPGARTAGLVEIRGNDGGTGAASSLTTSGYLSLGGDGTEDRDVPGEIRVADGGMLTVDGPLYMHSQAVLAMDGGTVSIGGQFVRREDAGGAPVYRVTLRDGMTDAEAPLQVRQRTNLDGVHLEIVLGDGFSPEEGDTFKILRYHSVLAASYGGGNRFAGLPQDAIIEHPDGLRFRIDYGSGSRDAVTLRVVVTNSLDMEFTAVAPGAFRMGSDPDEWGRSANEGPVREVRVTVPLWAGKTEVTARQFQVFLEESGYDGSADAPHHYLLTLEEDLEYPGGDLPIVYVSWYAAVRFCNWLSEREGLVPAYEIDGTDVRLRDLRAPGYRLPTEAEWEYLARGGTDTVYSWGDGYDAEGRYAPRALRGYSARGVYQFRPEPVGRYLANPFGLHDMHGNVAEWVWDGYASSHDPERTVDPTGPDGGRFRVVRGGSSANAPWYRRSASRTHASPGFTRYDLGFRVVRPQ